MLLESEASGVGFCVCDAVVLDTENGDMHFVLELRFREAIKCRVFKPHVTFDVAGVDSDMTTRGSIPI